MPKYKVTIIENYYATREYEVDAPNEKQAQEIAEDLNNDTTTPIEEIHFIEWNVDSIEKLCHACNQPEDDDGRCGCTNEDAN
uniref:Uncharacterized protein n=2 Tax=viral metagenome TaxID=1070528 RepID=A0A6H2A5X5_9ZZZZ